MCVPDGVVALCKPPQLRRDNTYIHQVFTFMCEKRAPAIKVETASPEVEARLHQQASFSFWSTNRVKSWSVPIAVVLWVSVRMAGLIRALFNMVNIRPANEIPIVHVKQCQSVSRSFVFNENMCT